MSPRDPAKARILVAEDDPAILELITVRLEVAGYTVIGARDGVVALERFGAARPVAAILDINMPRIDGLEVLRAVRAEPGFARMPILMLTARNAANDVARARTLGADDYLAKPFDDQALPARVARLLARGRLAPVAAPQTPAAAPRTEGAAPGAPLNADSYSFFM